MKREERELGKAAPFMQHVPTYDARAADVRLMILEFTEITGRGPSVGELRVYAQEDLRYITILVDLILLGYVERDVELINGRATTILRVTRKEEPADIAPVKRHVPKKQYGKPKTPEARAIRNAKDRARKLAARAKLQA